MPFTWIITSIFLWIITKEKQVNLQMFWERKKDSKYYESYSFFTFNKFYASSIAEKNKLKHLESADVLDGWSHQDASISFPIDHWLI